MEKNVGVIHKAIHGGKWVGLGSISNKILGVASFFLLARFLDPANYGVIAIVMMAAGIFNQMIITGFETAVLQRKNDIEKYFDSIWTFNVIKGIIIFLILFFSAPWISQFFHAKESLSVIRLSGLFVLLPSLTSVYQIYLFRDFNFDKIFIRDILGQIGYIAVGAFYVFFIDANVWALFYANIARYVIPLVYIYFIFPHLHKIYINFSLLKELTSYSKWIVGQNFVDYFLSLIDNIFIGRFLSPEILGYYSKARNLSAVGFSPIGNISKSLSFVAFSKVQDEKSKLQEGFLMTLDLMIFLGITNIFFIWFGAEAFIKILLGMQWMPIVSTLKVFAVSALFGSFIAVAYSLFDGAGKPSVTFKSKVFSLVLYALLSYLGIMYKGMVGAALGITLSNFIVIFYIIYKLSKVYDIHFSSFAKRFFLLLIPAIPSIIMVIILKVLPIFDNPMILIVLLIILYLVFFFFFWLLGKRYERGGWNTFRLALTTIFKRKIEEKL